MALLTVVAAVCLINAVTMLFGREEIQVSHGELIHTWRILFARRQARYPAALITNLRAATEAEGEKAKGLISAFRDFGSHGAVSFESGGQTVKVGAVVVANRASSLSIGSPGDCRVRLLPLDQGDHFTTSASCQTIAWPTLIDPLISSNAIVGEP